MLARLIEGDSAIDSWLEKCLTLAKDANSNLTFHQISIPWVWWKHFQGLDGIDFGAKRGRNFIGNKSRVEERVLLVVEKDGELVGAAPLTLIHSTLKTGIPPLRLIGFSADSVVMFYQDLLTHNQARSEIVNAMVNALCEFAEPKNLIVFLGHIPEDSANIPLLQSAITEKTNLGWQGGMVVNRYRGGIFPWTLQPLKNALEAIEKLIEGDSEAQAKVRGLVEKLDQQGPALLNFRATGLALERELGSLLEEISNTESLKPGCDAIRNSILPGVIKYPYLRLPESVEAYQSSLSSSRRYYFRRYMGKFETAGGSFENIEPSNLSEQDIEDYLSLHRERWGSDSVAVNDSTLGFHRDIAREGGRLGVFRLFFAKLGEKRIAAHACFDIGDRREYFFSGRDPELEDLRAGKLLVYHTVVDAVSKGFKTYDFGYGGDEYKSEFTKTFRTARSFFLGRPEIFPDLRLLFQKYEFLAFDE